MSFSGLGIGVTALTAAQREMEVAAHNVANSNTEGYTRQRVDLATARPAAGTYGTRGDGMRGMGVTVDDVVRLRNELVDASYRSEAGNNASWSARADILNRAQQVLGPFDGGAPQALSAFWASWDQLSLYPQDLAARRGVVDAGRSLSQWMNTAASGVDNLVDEAGRQLEDGVAEVNRLIDQVAELNLSIKDATIGKQSPNDLMDQRDRLVDRLSELTGATARRLEFNVVDIYIGTKGVVRGTTTEKLNDPTGTSITWANDGTTAVLGGRLGGVVQTATVDLPSMRAQLDAIAVGIRDTINGAHRDDSGGTPPRPTYDLDGNPGGDFFTGADALNLKLTAALENDPRKIAASLSGLSADANNALAIAQLRTKSAVDTDGAGGADATVLNALNGFAGRIGSVAAEAMNRSGAAANVLDGLKKERSATNSVSVDEEMANIVRFQRSYEAAARVISIMDEMLDKLINGTGAGR
jgi:flagellar hook-associated protein 1 FlgK